MKRYLLLLLVVVGMVAQPVYAQTKPATKAPVKKKTVVKKPVAVKSKNDTTYTYYSNKKVSVKTAPWANMEQKIWLYDLKGNVTYTFTNSRKHGVTRTEFKFHPNGAVSEAITSTNPDGGIVGYKTYTTFSTTNDPEWRHSEEWPMHKLEMPDNFYWDKKTGQWKKQETIECQPAPMGR